MSDSLATQPDRSARWAWFIWGLLVFIGVALYELFQQPAFLGVTLSLKFGWSDALTAFWLRRRDPDRRRGSANFYIYLGYSLWKIAMAGGVIAFILPMIHGMFVGGKMNPKNNDPIFAVFSGSCGTALLGMWASSAITCVGLLQAWRKGYKLWLHDHVATARKHDDWPPEYGILNRLERIALPSAMLIVTTVIIALDCLFVTLMNALIGPPANNVYLGMVILSVFGVAIGSLVLLDWIRERLVAPWPLAAWPDVNLID